ncbi:peptidase inhibitor family I36 protein [Amycolatopsis sp. H6(2020)]|nr:peptidase inhibitor family I36 protein [Amycolatopsis sp. H6(2020)]
MTTLVKRSIIAAATATAFFGVVSPAEAQPATTDSDPAAVFALTDCPRNYVCLWTNVGWQGSRWQGTRTNEVLPSFINNLSLSSYNNDPTRTACLYRGERFTDVVMREGPGSRRADLRLDPRPDHGNWALEFSSQSWNC